MDKNFYKNVETDQKSRKNVKNHVQIDLEYKEDHQKSLKFGRKCDINGPKVMKIHQKLL